MEKATEGIREMVETLHSDLARMIMYFQKRVLDQQEMLQIRDAEFEAFEEMVERLEKLYYEDQKDLEAKI